jgi:hypothetical protein
MKLILVGLLVLMSLAPWTPATAASGLNFGWDDCGAAPGTLDRAFACDVNTGVWVLVGSYFVSQALDHCVANEVVIDI